MADTQMNQSTSTSQAAQHSLLTADDLARQPNDDSRYELVKGVLRFKLSLCRVSHCELESRFVVVRFIAHLPVNNRRRTFQ